MGVRDCRIAGLPARVFRISFSGELAYEINVPADWGRSVWEAAMSAGRAEDIIAYGTEAMGTLRIEKGHVAGGELNGQTTPQDLGLGHLVSTKKDFIGKALLARPGLQDPERPRLVGLAPSDGKTRIRAGAHIVVETSGAGSAIGHVSSTAWSPTLGHPIALALVAGGLGIGLAGAWAATRVLKNFLFEVTPFDPLTFAAVSLLLALVALAACYIPARRAAGIDPLVALRCE